MRDMKEKIEAKAKITIERLWKRKSNKHNEKEQSGIHPSRVYCLPAWVSLWTLLWYCLKLVEANVRSYPHPAFSSQLETTLICVCWGWLHMGEVKVPCKVGLYQHRAMRWASKGPKSPASACWPAISLVIEPPDSERASGGVGRMGPLALL